MKNKKGNVHLMMLIPFLLIMILGLIIMSKVGGEELSIVNKLWGGNEGGPVLGSKTIVEIKPGTGYDFETGYSKEKNIWFYSNACDDLTPPKDYVKKSIYTLHHSEISGASYGNIESTEQSALVRASYELKQKLEDNTEKLPDVDCTALPSDVPQYKDVLNDITLTPYVSVGDILCIKTNKNHIIKAKITATGKEISFTEYYCDLPDEGKTVFENGNYESDIPGSGPKIKWWYQRLNYEPGRTDMETGDEYSSYEVFSGQTEVEVDASYDPSNGWDSQNYGLTGTWTGIDFDNPTVVLGSQEQYDMWYSKEHGILFDSGFREVTDGTNDYREMLSSTFQRGLYIGGEAQADNLFCDKLIPTLYYPIKDDLAYLPPMHTNAYYCLITSENRVVKLHWFSEAGEDPKFEWWYES